MPHPLFQNIQCYVRSPVSPGLTSPRALRSRVLQASEYFWSYLHFLLKLRLECIFRVLPWLLRGYEVLIPRVVLSSYGIVPRVLEVESKNQAEGQISLESSFLIFQKIYKISHRWYVSSSPQALNQIPKNWKKWSKWMWHTLQCILYICNDGKNRKKWFKIQKTLFSIKFLKKWLSK
jgi:hypothetical protein